MKIKATAVRGKDLLPGDLFSTAGQDYWDNFSLKESIGERVYIRTTCPARNADDSNAIVYLIEIVRENQI